MKQMVVHNWQKGLEMKQEPYTSNSYLNDYLMDKCQNIFFINIPCRFITFEITDTDSNKHHIPINMKRFLFDYDHSVFLECNKKALSENEKQGYKLSSVLHESVKPGLGYITDSLEMMFIRYWLSDGSLLGWYRDCGVIPHTYDMDIAIPFEDYKENIQKHFIGNPNVHIYRVMGNQTDGLELGLVDYWNNFQYDIFLVYPLNATHMYHGTQGEREKYRLVYF